MISRRVGALLLIFSVAAALIAPSSVAFAAADTSCQKQLDLVNYRSSILRSYRQTEAKKYRTQRDQWAARISYASQWVSKDAQKAREALYKYDALHAATDGELAKQINANLYLETKPLDCSAAKQAQVARKLDEIRGYQGKKIVGGNALITKQKKLETRYYKKDFSKASAAMMRKLQAAKAKHPQPTQPKMSIKGS